MSESSGKPLRQVHIGPPFQTPPSGEVLFGIHHSSPVGACLSRDAEARRIGWKRSQELPTRTKQTAWERRHA